MNNKAWTQCRGCASPVCIVRGQCAFPKADPPDRVVEAGGELIERLTAYAWMMRDMDAPDSIFDLLNEAATALDSSQSLLARRTEALDRERLARIIDPNSWTRFENRKRESNWQDWPHLQRRYCAPSLAKADLIRSEALSDLGNEEKQEVRSSVADSGGTASPKSDNHNQTEGAR